MLEPFLSVITFVLLFIVMALTGGAPVGTLIFIMIVSWIISIMWGSIMWAANETILGLIASLALGTIAGLCFFFFLRWLACGFAGGSVLPLTDCIS